MSRKFTKEQRLQWGAVFSKEASEALQANYTAKRRQLAAHIVVTLKEKYNV